MTQIIRFFWQMCLFRNGPEALPGSVFATGMVLAIYLPIALFVSLFTRPGEAMLTTLTTVIVGISVQALVTYLLLQFKNYQSRFLATWSALLGTNAFMLIVLLPVSYVIVNSETGTLRMFADSVWWVCFGWWLAIAGHIYHRAVEISVLQGSAIAFLIELIGVIIAFSLFPR